jgi:hypothetical protein
MTEFAGAVANAARSRWPAGELPDEHSNGFSSLMLLAGTEPHTRILYLLAWSAASVVVSCADGLKSASIGVDGWVHLPLLRQSIDVILADLDAVPDGDAVRRAVATELRRVLTNGGRCIAAVTRGRRPRNPRQWRHYRLVPPVTKWREALSSAGVVQLDVARLRFEGARITEVRPSPQPCRRGLPAGSAHAVALVLSPTTVEGPSVVHEISRALRRELRIENPINRVQVRKIGKTAAFLSTDGARVVVRMPCSPLAVARARQNHAALEAIQRSRTGISVDLVPKPLGHGAIGSQSYFVETCVPGTPREARVAPIDWESQAVELITALHVSTARRRLLTDSWFQQNVEPALESIERSDRAGETRRALTWLRSLLRHLLIGRELPLVFSHGDFTGSNCLYDARGRLSGVVDWELSRPDALPLLDLLQCFDLPAEYRDGRWQRAELVFDAVEGRGALSDAPALTRYVSMLGLPDDVIPALLLMHWVDHAGARVLARQPDERWFQHRVTAPVARLRGLSTRFREWSE